MISRALTGGFLFYGGKSEEFRAAESDMLRSRAEMAGSTDYVPKQLAVSLPSVRIFHGHKGHLGSDFDSGNKLSCR